ncbi:MAG: Gfo/Idh/MocA family oxidoreductase [Bryobacterales bacterium]|nr:Gfo/Idh/MocA family oxidoreductase [Bryobacterales bacterium]
MKSQGVKIGRRAFVGAAGWMIVSPQAVRGSQANSAIRVGLLGCGGRGTVVATSMVENAGARVTALGDLFEDQIPKAAAHFNGLLEKRGQGRIDAAQMFSGISAPERIVASKEVDAIIIATPPYFHPEHLDLVVRAGKHAYCEKPVAVDVPGTKRVLEIGKRAEGKLSLEVGFQIRKAPPFAELVRRIHEGAIGEITSGQAYYYCPFLDVVRPGIPMRQARLRHWMYDRALSGDIIVEQNIHAIDICNWVLKGRPVSAVGHGTRNGRPDNGNCYGQCAVTFTYPNNVIVSFSSKQVGKGGFDVNERFFGTLGNSQSPYSGTLGIDGDNPWTWKSPEAPAGGEFSQSGAFSDNLAQADSEKHKSFIESIVSGQFHNQAALGVESSLSAMLGRMAMDTGKEVTWDELNRSKEVLEAKLDLSKVV